MKAREGLENAVNDFPLPPGVPGTAAELPPAEGEKEPHFVDKACSFKGKNDLGNAERFLTRFGGAFLHVRDRGWAAWDGMRFNLDEGNRQAHLCAHATSVCIAGEADHVAPPRAPDDKPWRLRPHDPADRISRVAAAVYDPDAECPEWAAFVAWAQPDPDVRQLL